MNVLNRVQSLPPQSYAQSDKDDTVDLIGLVAVIWRRKLVVLVCTVAVMAIAYFVLARTTPTYTATASVLLDSRQPNVTNLDEVVSGLSLTNSVVAGELSILTSDILIGEVVDDLGLVNEPEFDPNRTRVVGMTTRLRDMVQRVADRVLGLVGIAPPLASEPEVAPALTPAEARTQTIQLVQSRLSVEQGGISYVIHVSYNSPDPEMASRVANAVANRYIEDQIAEKRDTTRRASDWLRDRIEALKQQVEEAEADVVSYKADQSLNGGGVEITTQQLAEINSELVRARSDKVVAEARLNQVKRLVESGGLDAAASAVTSPLMLELSQQLVALQRRSAELRKWYGPNHPDVVAVTAELADLRRSVETEIRKTMDGLASQVEIETAREQQLSSSLVEVEARMVELSKASVRLRQLERFADATRSVYENFLARYKETTEQAGIQRADARVIDVAEMPSWPSHPRKKLVFAASSVLGLALGLAMVFVLELMSTAVRTSQQLRARTGLLVLASLPALRGGGRGRNAARSILGDKATPFSEAVRNLRASLPLPSVDGKGHVLLVTSATPNEGKSTTSVALGRVCQAIHRSTVVVECDLRRPSISRMVFPPKLLSMGREGCVVDYLEGSADLDSVIAVDQRTGLSIVGARKASGRSADLFATERFREFVDELSSRYDVVILDTAPILSFSDTISVAATAESALFVVRANRTSIRDVEAGIELLQASGVRVAGTVLTHAKRKSGPVYMAARNYANAR